MYLPLLVIATAAIHLLAIVLLIRGLRAHTRAGCTERAVWCFVLAIVQSAAVLSAYVAGLSASFAVVAKADPSEKAAILTAQLGTTMQIVSCGVLAALPPVIYAFVLVVRRYRFPATPATSPPPAAS